MTSFDPSYGYTLPKLLEVKAPPAPLGFTEFWQSTYKNIISLETDPTLTRSGKFKNNFELYDFSFNSTDTIRIHGWALIPKSEPVNRVMVVGHGYGGCEEPEPDVPLADCAYLYLCYRGISRSHHPQIPENPSYHVLYHIDDKDKYIFKGCVEDTWLAVSAAKQLFPTASEHIGFMGISFSGGIGALALPWDNRIKMAHIQVPSFGHQPLRMELPSWGSANAVQNYYRSHPQVLETLSFYDAAIAAQYINIPMHIAVAKADPVVAPPGQFAIYNNIVAPKSLFVLEKGHMEYPEHKREQSALLAELRTFFNDL